MLSRWKFFVRSNEIRKSLTEQPLDAVLDQQVFPFSRNCKICHSLINGQICSKCKLNNDHCAMCNLRYDFTLKKSLILTIFGHKHKIKNFIKKFGIFHKKISTAFDFVLYWNKIANFESKLH